MFGTRNSLQNEHGSVGKSTLANTDLKLYFAHTLKLQFYSQRHSHDVISQALPFSCAMLKSLGMRLTDTI